MDYCKMKPLLVFFLLIPAFSVLSADVKPGFNVTRAGAVTTYQILSTGPYNPTSTAVTGTGITPLNAQMSANSSAFVRDLGIPVGETIAAVRVSSPFSQAAMATAIISLLRNPTLFNAAMIAGSALYTYLNSQDITPIGNGLVTMSDPNFVTSTTKVAEPVGAGWIGHGSIGGYMTFAQCNAAYSNSCIVSSSNALYSWSGTGTYCSGGTKNQYGACIPAGQGQTATRVNVNDAKLNTVMAATPPSATVTPNIVKNLFDADITGAHLPATTSPTVGLPSPTSYTSPMVTSVSPTGQVQTRTDVQNFTQVNSSTLNTTNTSTYVTTNTDGSTTTTTINNAPPAPVVPTDFYTDCDKYPDAAGCLKLGSVPTPDPITTNNVAMALSPVSLGSGVCPAPIVIPMRGQPDITLSYQPYCDFATQSSAFIISLSWLSAGLIVLGAIRED